MKASETPTVRILDKTFALSLSAEQIAEKVTAAAARISEELRHRDPIFVSVLNGAFMFASDLIRQLDFPAKVSFVKLSSYEGVSTTGSVHELIGLSENIEGRLVVVVEDIVDTGYTMQHLLQALEKHRPQEIRIASLFVKPENLKVDLTIDYPLFHIPNDFIVGYGLDYDGYGRNLPAIYTLVES